MAKSSFSIKTGSWLVKRKKYHEIGGKTLAFICAAVVIILTLALVYFISTKGLVTFFINKVSFKEFFLSTEWWPDRPLIEGGPKVGALPFIIGSLVVSMLAVLVSPNRVCSTGNIFLCRSVTVYTYHIYSLVNVW